MAKLGGTFCLARAMTRAPGFPAAIHAGYAPSNNQETP